ncbi:DUF5753 domain-containing protein [Streptomyces xiangluensis]|uniref:DUF5753 domain-containing protein n=1 Tax=Streptomyces xiangluensis TaxID=2665720 RepID=A0ABV8YY16_9ACTN
MANERDRGWWQEFRDLMPTKALDLAELEHHGAYIRTFQVVHIPGLLQTEDHIRSASRFVEPSLPERELENRVAFRLRRQQILDAGRPYDAVIHEAALRMRVGGPKTARAQLKRILQEPERERVTIRVIPFTADDFAGMGLSMFYVGGRVPQLDTVQEDTGHGSLFIDASAKLHRYRGRLDRISGIALDPAPSLDLIRCIAREL